MVQLSRRELLLVTAGAPAATAMASAVKAAVPAQAMVTDMANEGYWASVAQGYDMTEAITNAENGNWGVMARSVLEAYIDHTHRVNRENSFFSRRVYGPLFRDIVADVAGRLGAQVGEVAFTRGATEALQNIIGGFNMLGPDDAVMYADLDYGSVQAAMAFQARRCGAAVVQLNVPEPVSHGELVDFYRDAMSQNPNVKLLLLTHISHRTGLMMPVRAIVQEARARGIRVVVDAAHSWGQVDFKVDDLGADYIGFNLHKWIGAPIGVGAMYIRADRLADIDTNISAEPAQADSIWGRVHTGTSNFAAYLTVPDAFAFHDRIGGGAKERRLRHLRQTWVGAVQASDVSDHVDILTPEDKRLHGGITSFRIKGVTGADDNKAIVEDMLTQHGIFTVHRTGVAKGGCVRITPALYNSQRDMQDVAAAVIAAARKAVTPQS
ncbi:aminotransferase class V-fold PLP-dependent enzyme [Kordiimonas sp.]|uniref:aminotransferase class V-fold PLP-dependent enzyme n=1 Tax=Kordiimonas sp. TaxID=1970157 RepID=UPI003A90AD96